MIQLLSVKYKKSIAWPLLVLFSLQLLSPLYVSGRLWANYETGYRYRYDSWSPERKAAHTIPFFNTGVKAGSGIMAPEKNTITVNAAGIAAHQPFIGGPSSPEASSFKAIGSNNLVNLFTGDFSYSIQLLDIGGYPVNLFYNGGIGMEQEASWVGLGWNINPGTVSRNMRGVPDDFNGEDTLVQNQNVKPNRTWGGEVGINGELIGIPKPNINLSLGFSYNNYLGPALDLGASVSLTIPIFENVKNEKSAPVSDSAGGGGLSGGLNLGLGAKLSSRSGLTFSPSLGANLSIVDSRIDIGVKLSTSYNSRTGIKDLNLSSQTSTYRFTLDKKFNIGTSSLGGELGSTTFSFARPSYMPTLRMPMENANYSGQLELGGGMFGLRGAITAAGYYSESKVPTESRRVRKPLVGFMYSEKAMSNSNAVMDFNRLNDAEVTPRTPIVSAPQYSYDIFSIQGEGTGGSIRAYRGDMGFMRDNVTSSKDKNISIGFDIAPPGHYGGNWNIISMPTRVGGWEDANNTLQQALSFKPLQTGSLFENVYFRNPGESTVTSDEELKRVGYDNLVRFKLGGSNVTPRLESQLEQFSKTNINYKGLANISSNNTLTNREKRTQVTTMLTAEDASKIGLEKQIRNYTGGFDGNNNILYDTISRIGGYRKKHHISEIDVLEQNGMRYIYGIPEYSGVQKDFTFSVKATPASPANSLVAFTSTEPTVSSEHMTNSAKLDGYVQSQETPAYASSFLITGLLSPDYVDVTGNGITEDDLGGSVKFNYTKSTGLHRWRTPRNNSTAQLAHFNEGLRTEKKDNKATISYGEREAWYLNSIESKAMIAIFKTESRNDAKGVIDSFDARVNGGEDVNKRLSRIDLYTKAEIKAKGINNAKPIKTVQFEYDYSLCNGTPDNYTGGGKLTLKSVYFSSNGQTRQVKDKYVFNYGNTSSQSDNPSYAYNSSDRWGTYKKDSLGSSGQTTNTDYPYTSNSKVKNDEYAGAWSLKKILLPSGGQMEIQYEADDYAYVQNRRACNMYNVFGLGKTSAYTTSNALYTLGLSSTDNMYVYIKLPQALEATTAAKQKEEIYSKYLEGIKQLAFKLMINMPKGPEPLTVYAEYEDYGLCSNSAGKDQIYLKLKPVDGKSPLAKSSIGFLTENMPGQAFTGYDVEVNGVAAFVEMVGSMLGSLKGAFKNVENQMREAGKGRTIVLENSLVRLTNPFKRKFGGGVRVKKVLVKDNWSAMTGKYTSTYGQEYEYTTTEKINGIDASISSGVASYEPGVGSEENPFREIIAFSDKMPLASAQYGAIEMPVLEAFFPGPSVGYSKVTVRSIHRKGTHGDSLVRSAIGKQVTEFNTAREYPTYWGYTPMSVMDYNKKPFLSLLYKEIINRRTLSQGFFVETNDMHGKMKSQLSYSESDEKTPLTASYHSYKNTGRNGLNDKVDFVFNEEGGTIHSGNMGIDVELMTDVREFRVLSNGFNGQIQTDFFSFVPWPIFVIPMLPLKTYMENKYRAVTCTKLINYHAIEDSVVVVDKGSVVTSKTIAYDAQTGKPLITQTANEFNDPMFTVNYPAYWAYSGMGLAYKNIGFGYNGVTFYDGRLTSGQDQSVFESGDELYITSMSTPGSGCAAAIATPNPTYRIWVFDTNKSNTSLTVPVKDLVFMDATGKPFTANNVSFRIIRSGRRNNLDLSATAATSMKVPVQNGKLVLNNSINVISASATAFKEKWSVDCLDFTYISNPYKSGILGAFKPYRSYTYYASRNDSVLGAPTAVRKNGYIANFSNFWNFNGQNNLVPDLANNKWVWNSELINVNTRGRDVETKDALNRYTSAQFGFFKNLMVAVAQNAQSSEMLYEGFEDNGYNESINGTGYCNSPAKFGAPDYVTEYTGGNSNPYGVAYNVVNNGDGTQTLTVTFTSIPPGTCASTLSWYDGTWHNSTSGPTSPRTYTMPVGNWQYRLTFQCSNVTIDLDASLNNSGPGIRPHTGSKMMMLMPNGRDTLPLYVGNYANYNTDSIRFIFPTQPLISTNTHGGVAGVNGSATINKTPGGTANGSLGPNYLAGFNVSTSCPGGIGCGGVTFNGNTSMTAYYIPTQSTSIEMYLEGQSNFYGSCGSGSLSVAGGGVTVYDKDNNVVATGGSGGCTVSSRCSFSMTNYSYTVGQVYRIVSNVSFYGSVPSCGPSSGFSLNILNYIALQGSYYAIPCYKDVVTDTTVICSSYTQPMGYSAAMFNPGFGISKGKRMLFSAWVREDCGNANNVPCFKTNYTNTSIELRADNSGSTFIPLTLIPTGSIIEGWQKLEGEFTVPPDFNYYKVDMIFRNNDPSKPAYFDDIRIQPFNSNMKSYVYDRRSLRMSAELDENNYATFYEYNEENELIRVKKETIQGIKTIRESRSAKQKSITDVQ